MHVTDTRATAVSQVVTRPADYRDRAGDWYAYHDRERRKEIAAILRDHAEVIDEHEDNPIGYRGHHSPELQRVLNYMRTAPILGKYFVYASEPWKGYRLATIDERGKPPEVMDEPVYASEEEAMHGVFLKRVEDILGSDD